MFQRKKLSLAIATAVSISALGMSVPTFAQDETETQLEEVVVTGSRISRDQFSSSSPISTFDTEDLTNSGVVSVDEFLKDVPAFTGYQMGTSTNNGSANGQKKIDMRGLGFNRTLVLINGRRTIGDVNGDGAVDLNTVPEALIKRVDVLKDGASTIYGSDAIAGVVNFVLDDEFEGFEAKLNYGTGQSGIAQNSGFSLKGGVAGDRGNFVMALSYSDQKEMKQEEREFSNATLYPRLQDNGQFALQTSGSSNSRRIRVVDPAGNASGQYILDGDSARSFNSATDLYDYSPVNALVTPNETIQLSGIGKVEISEGLEGFMELTYTRRTSQQRLAPDASFAVSSNVQTPNNGVQRNDFVPASNPFNPFGVNPRNSVGLSNLDVRINRRFEESGGRLFRQTNNQYRGLFGVRGSMFDDSVDWEVSYTRAESETLNATKNYGRFDRWATAVDPAACAASAECTAAGGVLNPFAEFGSISASQMNFLTAGDLKDQYLGKLDLLAASLSGSWFEMDGGTAGWAVGLEHRREEGFYSPDEFIGGGLTTGGASDPQEGKFSVSELWGEMLFPITDALSLSTSARYSDYDTSAGESFTYKLGLDWTITDDLRFRGGYSTGFRAPNISELNQGDSTGFPVASSPCEFGDRALAAGDITQAAYDNCKALGVDTSDAGEYGFAWQSLYTTSAPDKPLEPEESRSINLGLVYTPASVEGLRVGIDYWDIEIEKAIGAPAFNDLYRACFNSVGLSSPACASFPTGFTSFGIFPGDAQSKFGNLGLLTSNGVDLDVAYGSELSNGMTYDLTFSVTQHLSYKQEFPFTGAGATELVGTARGFNVFPETRFNLGANLARDNWSVSYGMRYIGETVDALRSPAATSDAVAETTIYHDLVGTYNYNNMSFTFGINNVTDQDPPYFHSAFNANTEPGMYDVIGRRMFANIKISY